MDYKIINNPPKIAWKDIKKYRDKGYLFPTIQIAEFYGDLYIKYTAYNRKVRYECIKQFKKYTATEIILERIDENGYCERHFNDAIIQLYLQQDLPLGFMQKITRRM